MCEHAGVVLSTTTTDTTLARAECCIFHSRKTFGVWSDDEDSECECDDPNSAGPSKRPDDSSSGAD